MSIVLLGHGDATFRWHNYVSCLCVAGLFGWQQKGTIAPPYDINERLDEYHQTDLRKVDDDDALDLGQSIHRGITALETGQITDEQIKGLNLIREEDGLDVRVLRELADYALSGGFIIGGRVHLDEL